MEGTPLAAAVGVIGILGKPVVETGCRLIENLLGEPCKVAGNLIADQIYNWQWRNRIQIAVQAQQIMDDNDIAARVLPKGFLLPLLQAAGDVEEPELQSLWARLLTSALVDEEAESRALIEALKILTPRDARTLDMLVKHPSHFRGGFSFRETDPPSRNSYGRLIAANILQPMISAKAGKTWKEASSVTVSDNKLKLSLLGQQFIEVVIRGSKKKPTPKTQP